MRKIAFAALLLSPAVAAADANLTSDFGPVFLQFGPQNAVMGTYPSYNGRLVGRIRGDGVIDLIWAQPSGARPCAEEREGTPFWGTAQWTPSGTELIGRWAYCDDATGSAGRWNAVVIAGAVPAPASDAAAVNDDDLFGPVRFEWGQMAAYDYDDKGLAVDLDCDGALDRVITQVNGINPDGPFFDLMMIASHNGDIVYESVSFLMGGDGGDGSVCVGEGGPAPEISIGPRFDTGEFNDMFGYGTQCGQSVILDDGMCDRKWLFWEPESAAESRIFLFQN